METFQTITRAQIMMRIKLSVLDQNNYRNIIKHPINLCDYFREPRAEPVFNIIYQQALKVGIKQIKCPIAPVSS